MMWSSSSWRRFPSAIMLLWLVCVLVWLLPPVASGSHWSSRSERAESQRQEREDYLRLKQLGQDSVGHTPEAAKLRHYQLRKKRRQGFLLGGRKEASLASVLFPGASPELYLPDEEVVMTTEMVSSKKTHVPFEFYDLPGVCPAPALNKVRVMNHRHQRKNLGARLQGMELKPAPYPLQVKRDVGCTAICNKQIGARDIKWLRKLVERDYRVHLTFDQLPVLMRSEKLNYAVRGYPVGFHVPPEYSLTGLSDEYYLYNHLKFNITYQQDGDGEGVYITGFDVYPISIAHQKDGSTCGGSIARSELVHDNEELDPDELEEDDDDNVPEPVNDPRTYLPLRVGATGEDLEVIFSYEVEWVPSNLPWADRWDVYLIGTPDDDIHFFAIINSLMIVLFLMGAIATIMIRTLRNDISAYNEVSSHLAASTKDDAGVAEETGWKLVHGDVFRPPTTSPMLLSILVGTGAQIGMAMLITLLAAMCKLLNPIKKGHTLTAILIVYVLSGSISGYISARIYKFCTPKSSAFWRMNAILTATALPGTIWFIFTLLNVWLSFAGAATAVSVVTLICLFALWVCVSAPLVLVGSYFGYETAVMEVPTKTKQIPRVIPELPWYYLPPASFMLGGILPFGSVCIELFFILSALWLHQLYYVMGFLLAVVLILAATCAQVSVVMVYLQLCAEDYRWWWKSFGNCAFAGVYLFGYSLWFLTTRLDLVGVLPVVVYLTYMGMISLCFSIFCGSVGFLCAFLFNRTIYGAVKVD